MKLNHLHLNVVDMAEACAFFERFLGFRTSSQHGRGVFMRDADGFLLALDPLPTGEAQPELPAWLHAGYCVADAETVRSVYAAMRTAQVPMARELREEAGVFASFFCIAPGGLKLEISWHSEEV